MATLESGFERKAAEAFLDDAERQLADEQANLAFQFIELVHLRLRSYGRRHGYDVESTIESLEPVDATRSGSTVSVEIEWGMGKQMTFWEFGVSPHTIRGNPILSFVWENPPEWVTEEFEQARDPGGRFASGYRVFLPEVSHPGIPESRAIRDSIHAFREVLES